MHTLLEANGATGQHVPAFLAKLWKIVDDQTTNDLICWSDSGNSFVIHNQAKFARELLPLYYKHNNMASFVRQLNMYGFHKVVSVEQGGLKVDKDEIEFAHPFFLRGQESSLELIKRKLPSTKLEDSRAHPESLSKVLIDVRQMKGRQETMDEKLLTMKRENESLWRELASLRQKHAKQQQIVSKLLQFLVGMMSQSQSRRLPSYKRRAPLMLNDTDSVKASKISRANRPEITGGPVIRDITEGDEPEDEYGDDNSQYIDNLVTSPDVPENEQQQDQQIGIINDFENPEQLLTVDPSVLIPNNDKKSAQASGKIIKMEPQAATSSGNMYYITGPGGIQQPVQVIYSQPQQIQDMVQGQQALIQQTTLPSSSSSAATPTTSTQQIEVPSSSAYHEKTLEKNQNQLLVARHPLNKKRTRTASVKEDLDFHVDEMQLGLEHLKDLFSADKSISETDALMGLFGEGAGHLDFGNNNVNNTGDDKSKTTQNNEAPIGNELVSYNPSLFELTEDDTHFFDDSSADFLDKELESMLTTEKDKLNTRTSFAPLTFTSLPSQTDDSLLHTPVDTPSSSSNILLTPPASSPSTNRRKRK